ncbi:MAG: hypothetical protein HQL35_07640 [Alphaproteobacteria bacterium]|nr:hypothetical protein [Alphaproteobacteria bacterium]
MLKRLFDKLPAGPTIAFGALYFIMPIVPEPHLVQKALMIRDGVAFAPIDWLDVVLHSTGGIVAVAKLLSLRGG